ncbi:hypothetical protein CK203_100663 [Vitis vinifera]|uniref:Aspartic peptidase DDI1-type domain-containing protein n=1 Tax=Vitis vinifera TaxID=29760 RepID=A0A438D661_VITVI|nr:hypothetical protein CK203_100663 [Vitis vinifera]
MLKKHSSPLFPQALHGKKGIRNASEILEDLCTIKRGLNVNKKAFLTEQVSAIIQCKSPLKYKDPGCPTISVMIGGKVVEKALLDLGASVNLLTILCLQEIGTWNGLMQLTFGNMTLELNIFYMSKKLITPEEEEGSRREGLPEPDVLATLQGWTRREEILPLFNEEEHKKLLKKRPQSLIEASTHGAEIYIPGRE